MKRSGMPRPTSCALSHVINLNKETESNEDTEPRHCANLLLAAGFIVLQTLETPISTYEVSPLNNCLAEQTELL